MAESESYLKALINIKLLKIFSFTIRIPLGVTVFKNRNHCYQINPRFRLFLPPFCCTDAAVAHKL